MRRRVNAFVMAVLMLVLSVTACFTDLTPASAAELILKVHYHREDGDYTDWSVWLWPDGQEGADYAFEEEDGEMVATMEVTPGVTSVGFIVRTPDWGKDIDADQFIDISEMVSGTVHVYIESGVEGYTKEYGDDAVTGTKLKTAVYNGDGTITVTMTGELGELALSAVPATEIFSVRGKESAVEVSELVYEGDFVYTLVLAEELNNAKSYTITYDDTDYSINMPIIYSTEEFEAAYTYDGDDLGAVWTAEKTSFRVWAPTAESMVLNLYEAGTPYQDDLIESIEMTPDVNGTWVAEKEGDLNGTYYTYSVTIDGVTQEACDPYARTTGVNGRRAMVIDLDSTDPEGWENDTNPHAGDSINDAVLYELHLRDLSADDESGMEYVGKFLSLAETGTTTSSGIATGLDHIKELGVTHIHLLPIYDFGSVDETYKYENLYNWGYDPVNYNVPEGSYSTDPYNGEVRVAELKQMVQTLHENDLSVVMDVVYNHVYSASDFCFNKLVPGYFSRINEDGTYSNGSGCGNDTASERAMVKKYIVDSVNYWVEEYHIDGFRFDLIGLLDTETVNEIIETVHESHPDVIFYGEGWTLDTNVTKEGYTLATQTNSAMTPGFAYFNDTIRDTLKGSVFNEEIGFVSGASGLESTIIDSFLGNVSWCSSPSQTVNYASCHDNLALFDRIRVSRTDASEEDLIRMNNLAASIYMLSEGVPFMQAGEEMLRSKPNGDGTYDSNSYASGDEVNSLKWGDLEDESYMEVFEYYKGLIAFRKAHGALRLSDAETVADTIKAVEGLDENVVAFDIAGGVNGETADEIYVIFNANEDETTVDLPSGTWNVYINDEKAGTEVIETIKDGSVTVAPISAMVLVRESGASLSGGGLTGKTVGFVVVGVIVVAGAVVIFLCNRKKKN